MTSLAADMQPVRLPCEFAARSLSDLARQVSRPHPDPAAHLGTGAEFQPVYADRPGWRASAACEFVRLAAGPGPAALKVTCASPPIGRYKE